MRGAVAMQSFSTLIQDSGTKVESHFETSIPLPSPGQDPIRQKHQQCKQTIVSSFNTLYQLLNQYISVIKDQDGETNSKQSCIMSNKPKGWTFLHA